MTISQAIKNLLMTILSWLSKKQPETHPSDSGTVIIVPSPKLELPHPEEKPDFTRAADKVNAHSILALWFVEWEVPMQYWCYWETAIDIQVYAQYPDYMLLWQGVTQDKPAFTWDAEGKRHLAIKPAWLNPGVIAHEQAHNSYSLLTDQEKIEFSNIYNSVKTTNSLIKLLYQINHYGLTNDIEGHAEIYRYLGQKIPSVLKYYYPRLF